MITDDQIKYMAKRFLMWRLPEDFHPDNGVSFDAVGNYNTPYEYKRKPTGTNLLNYTQAEAMVRHMLEGLPAIEAALAQPEADVVERVAKAICEIDGVQMYWSGRSAKYDDMTWEQKTDLRIVARAAIAAMPDAQTWNEAIDAAAKMLEDRAAHQLSKAWSDAHLADADAIRSLRKGGASE